MFDCYKTYDSMDFCRQFFILLMTLYTLCVCLFNLEIDSYFLYVLNELQAISFFYSARMPSRKDSSDVRIRSEGIVFEVQRNIPQSAYPTRVRSSP